jgi:hypothetical protein
VFVLDDISDGSRQIFGLTNAPAYASYGPGRLNIAVRVANKVRRFQVDVQLGCCGKQ